MGTAALLPSLKTGYTKYESFIRKFVYTDYYLILVSLLTYIGWVSKCTPFGITAAVLLMCAVLLGSDDVLPLSINMFGAMLVIWSEEPSDFLYMWPILIPLILCLIIFIVKNCRHRFRIGKMLFPQIAVSVALLLGGAGVASSQEYVRGLPNVLLLGIGVLAMYIFYDHFLKRDCKRDYALYLSRVMMYIGIVICLELITEILRSGIPMSQWDTAYWRIGWGSRNNIATFLMLTAGLTFYLSTRYRHGWIYLAIGLAQYFCIIMTFSRGGIIFGMISGAFALAFTIVKAKNKKRQLVYTAVILGIVLLLYLIFMDKINGMIAALIDRGMGSSGRTDLYKEAWSLFKAHPFLGVGMGYVGIYEGIHLDLNVIGIYWFHSTLFQVLASAGTVGIIAYLYYYGARLYVLFKNIKNSFNLFILAIWIGFEGYSMIDTGTFVPYPNMMLIIVMTLLLELNMTGDKKSEGYVTAYNSTTRRGKAISFARELDAVCESEYKRDCVSDCESEYKRGYESDCESNYDSDCESKYERDCENDCKSEYKHDCKREYESNYKNEYESDCER